MIHPSPALSNPFIPVLVTRDAEQLARRLAQQHPSAQQVEQIYHNLLVVLTVNNYLKILGIPTDLSQCDSWNPFLRMTGDAADLEVVGRGRLECCSISQADLENESPTYVMPSDVNDDERIGYIVVLLDEAGEKQDAQTAFLLGFTEQTRDGVINLKTLRSMFELPEYLAQVNQQPTITHLTRWFQGVVDQGWQMLDDLITPSMQLGYQVRSARTADGSPSEESSSDASFDTSLKRVYGKALTLDTEHGSQSVFLIAEVINPPDSDLQIELMLRPVNDQSFLPPGLDITVLDADHQPVMNAQARAENRTVELGFHAEPGDRFQLHIQLKDARLTESFLV
jgi:hypothetical protein